MARRYKLDRLGRWHSTLTGRIVTPTRYLKRLMRRGVPASARYPRPKRVTPRVRREEFAGLVKRERKRRVPRWTPPEPGESEILGEVRSRGMEDIGTALAESDVMSKIEDLPTGTRIRVTLTGTYRGEVIEIPAFEIDIGVGVAGPEEPMAHTNHLMFHMIRVLSAATQGEEKGYKLVDFEGEVVWTVEVVG